MIVEASTAGIFVGKKKSFQKRFFVVVGANGPSGGGPHEGEHLAATLMGDLGPQI